VSAFFFFSFFLIWLVFLLPRGLVASLELELELKQAHMTQKPLLWLEVGAHAVRKRSECAGMVWAGTGVALLFFVRRNFCQFFFFCVF